MSTAEITCHGGPVDGKIYTYATPLPKTVVFQKLSDEQPKDGSGYMKVDFIEYQRRGESFDYDWIEK